MNLLFDENLSPPLTARLSPLFPGCIHVRDIGLKQADDREIWQWARDHNCTVVTTDSDFVAMVIRIGPPPKVIHLERCDFPFSVIEDLLRRNAIRIAEFENDLSGSLLTLRTFRAGRPGDWYRPLCRIWTTEARLSGLTQVRHYLIVSGYFEPSAGVKLCRINGALRKQRCSADLPS